jgi:hypothetical protein
MLQKMKKIDDFSAGQLGFREELYITHLYCGNG